MHVGLSIDGFDQIVDSNFPGRPPRLQQDFQAAIKRALQFYSNFEDTENTISTAHSNKLLGCSQHAGCIWLPFRAYSKNNLLMATVASQPCCGAGLSALSSSHGHKHNKWRACILYIEKMEIGDPPLGWPLEKFENDAETYRVKGLKTSETKPPQLNNNLLCVSYFYRVSRGGKWHVAKRYRAWIPIPVVFVVTPFKLAPFIICTIPGGGTIKCRGSKAPAELCGLSWRATGEGPCALAYFTTRIPYEASVCNYSESASLLVSRGLIQINRIICARATAF